MMRWWGNKQKKLLNRTRRELLKCNNNTGLNFKNIFYIWLLENWDKTLRPFRSSCTYQYFCFLLDHNPETFQK